MVNSVQGNAIGTDYCINGPLESVFNYKISYG